MIKIQEIVYSALPPENKNVGWLTNDERDVKYLKLYFYINGRWKAVNDSDIPPL